MLSYLTQITPSYKTDGALVAAIGVDDLVILSTKDVFVVAHKDSVQDVKVVAQQLKS